MKLLLILLLISSSLAYAVPTAVTQTEMTVTTTSTIAVAANAKRNYLLVQNNGSTNVWMKFNSAHTGGQHFIVILAGGNVEFNNVVPRSAVYLASASSTDAVVIDEGIAP